MGFRKMEHGALPSFLGVAGRRIKCQKMLNKPDNSLPETLPVATEAGIGAENGNFS